MYLCTRKGISRVLTVNGGLLLIVALIIFVKKEKNKNTVEYL